MTKKNSLRLMQHPIDAMLQFDANANVDASVNRPLNFDSDTNRLNLILHKRLLNIIYARHEVMSHQCDYSLLDVSLIEEFHTLSVKILMCLSVTS